MRAGRGLTGKWKPARATAPSCPLSNATGVPISNTCTHPTAVEQGRALTVVALRHSTSRKKHRAISYFDQTSAEAFARSGVNVG